jgi:ribosomal protein S18 acetylase RimI-like enzyme
MNCQLSGLDRNRFGVVTAKADGFSSAEDVDAALAFCRANHVVLLIARVDTDRLDLSQRLEAAGGLLCDTLVYWELETQKAAPPSDAGGGFTFREFIETDRQPVLDIARELFSGFRGHYHSDPRLKKTDCDDAYVEWSESSINNIGDIHGIITAEDPSGICGYLTTRVLEDSRYELVLGGIRKQSAGRGGYRRLLQAGIRQAAERGLAYVRVSSQISHLAVQRTWIALGFLPTKSVHTFHVWLDSRSSTP